MEKLTVYLVAVLVLSAGYLSSARQVAASAPSLVSPMSDSALQNFEYSPSKDSELPLFPIMEIEGLQFETAIPLTPKSQDPVETFNMLSSLTFVEVEPLPVSINQISESVADIVVPETDDGEPAFAEATAGEQMTDGEQIIDGLVEDGQIVVEATTAPLASPTSTGSVKVVKKVLTKSSVVNKKVETKTAVLAASVSPSPSSSPKPSASATVKPTATPTEKPAESAKAVQLSNGGLNADLLFEMSNNYRRERGLAAFEKDARSCELAASRAPEIGEEIANGHMHSGLRARKLPYWNGENIISMRSEQAAFNWWINDKIHHDQIVGDYKYSCVACYGNSCVQEFTNFVPK